MKFKKPRFYLAERLCLWFTILATVPAVIFACFYPVSGLPLYGKSLLAALFTGIVYYSLRRERLQEEDEHASHHTRNPFNTDEHAHRTH